MIQKNELILHCLFSHVKQATENEAANTKKVISRRLKETRHPSASSTNNPPDSLAIKIRDLIIATPKRSFRCEQLELL